MSETPPNDKPAKDFNKIDLAQLQSFSFGTQWSQDKADPAGNSGGPREPRRDDRPRREGPGAGAPRDRRGFRKPAGPGEGGTTAAPGGDAPVSAPRERREGGFDSRGPRRDGPGAGAPRGDFRGGQGGPRHDGGPRFGGPREGGFAPREQGPYVSPFFNVTFYPDDTGFAALAKAIRGSCRTYELFEIARVIIGKNDRFIAVVQHKPSEEGAAATKRAPFAISVPDGVPFESEEAAINHVIEKHSGLFFDSAEVEIDAPKGNFQVVNRCTVTGELLGPPNYHRYNQIVQQHHAANIKLPFEVYRNKIESVREPEVITQWLEKMKKATRYTWKLTRPAAAAAAVAVAPAPVAEGEAAPADSAEASDAAPAAPEAAPAPSFDSFEEARQYLLTNAKDKVVRTVESVRFPGKNLETLPAGELRRTIEGALERQRRFPLDTANALRGRLRREGFTIFKKGSKGISYVCAVKRKFRVPGQTFSDSIGALISFIEKTPMIKASELSEKFLGFSAPAAPAKPVAPAEGAEAAPEPIAAPSAPALGAEQMAKLNRLNGDLRWLVSEGYVTEFIDGRLFAPAPVVESRKKEIEGAEHDPENFPEVPAEAPKAGSKAESEPVAQSASDAGAPAEESAVEKPAN
ncbi:MAG: hypothetical protein K0R17_3623 [Rariglobus sp.]|jgi:hypothetical protein|nr:hypothetical protein [Rariglobus sp.]